MLPCGVVYDLLPMHIEKLTSEETTKLIEEHLESCENCRKLKADREIELPIRRAAKPKFEFLKKLIRVGRCDSSRVTFNGLITRF